MISVWYHREQGPRARRRPVRPGALAWPPPPPPPPPEAEQIAAWEAELRRGELV